MLNSFIFAVLISSILGFLAGLGVGGGSLLILWLTLVLEVDHPQARIINLLFFIPAAVISSFYRWKQGIINWKQILPAVAVGCIAAAICTILSRKIDLNLIEKIFGGLLIVAGLREVFYKSKSPR